MSVETIKYAGMKLTIEGAAEFEKSLKQINSEMKLSSAELQKSTAEYGRNSSSIEHLTARQKDLESRLKSQKDVTKNLTTALDEVKKEYGENSIEANKMQAKVLESEAAEIKYEKALKDVNKQLAEKSGFSAKANAFFDAIKKGAEESNKELIKFGENIKAAGDKMQSVGNSLSTHVTAPIIAAGTLATKMFMDFDDSMRKVQATMGATPEQMERLTSKAREMGATTRFSASEAAEALNYMAMAGWDADKAIEALPGVMNLAAASGENLGTVSDIVTDALTAFGMTADESGHFADVLAKAASSSNTNVGMMGETFKYVAPLAGALGYSVEDTSVAIGLMANAGIKASQAGTDLRAILTRLVKPTKESESAMAALGLSMTDADNNMKPLNKLLVDMREAFRNGTVEVSELAIRLADMSEAETNAYLKAEKITGATKKMYLEQRELILSSKEVTGTTVELSDAQQTMYAAMLGGQRAMSSLLAIVNASDEDFDTLTENINNANGAAQEMADIMEGGLGGSMRNLRSASEELALVFGESLAGYAQELVDKLTDMIRKFSEMDEGTQRAILTFAGVAAAVGPVIKVTGMLTSGVGEVIIAFGKAQGAVMAFQAAIGPVGWAIEIVVGLIAAGTIAWNVYKKAQEEARQEMLHAGERLNKLADNINTVTEKQEKINQLSVRYKELKTAIDNGTMSAEAAKEAEAELAAIKQTLIDLSDGFITAHSAENKSLEELFDTVEALTESEKNRAVMNLQVAISETNIEAIQREQEALETRKAAIEDQIQIQGDMYVAFNQLNNEHQNLIDALHTGAITEQEFYDGLQNITSSLNELNSEYWFSKDNLHLLDHTVGEVGKNFNKLDTELNSVNDDLAAANGTIDEYNAQTERLAELTGEASDTLKEHADTVGAAGTAEQDLADQRKQNVDDFISGLEDETAAYSEAQEKQAAIAEQRKLDDDDVTARLIENANELGLSLDEYKKKLEEQEKAIENYAKKSTAAFNAIKEESAVSVATLTDNLTKNSEAVEAWSINLATLTERGVNIGLLKQLRDAGPESAKTVKALVDASDEELEKLNTAFEKGSRVAVESMQRELGLPSTINTGSDMIDKVAQGTERNDAFKNAATQQVVNTRQAMDNQVQMSNFQSVGNEMANGVAAGIQNSSSIVSNAATNLINNSLQAMRSAASISSPSKATREIAEFMGEGLVVGSQSVMSKVVNSSKDMAKNYINTLKAGIKLDSSDLSQSAGSVLSSFEESLKGIESNITLKGAQSGGSVTSNNDINFDGLFRGANFIVGGENDIKKIAKEVTREVMRQITKESSYESRIRGAAIH